MNPTAQHVADAGRVLQLVSFVHRRTAIRPASETEAKQIAVIWADMFARYQLELPDLTEAVKRRAFKHPDAPEPGEIVQWARDVRQERTSREQADPQLRAAHEARLDGPDADVIAIDKPRATDAQRQAAIRSFTERMGIGDA